MMDPRQSYVSADTGQYMTEKEALADPEKSYLRTFMVAARLKEERQQGFSDGWHAGRKAFLNTMEGFA